MYTPTIGLEVHAELKTKSKMFCGCSNDPHASEPNTNICPVCLAHPGTLPVANFAAVKNVILFGTAVGGVIATYSEFDRKNYFYPDIPKAYQISQYAFPFVKGGELAGVALTRVHLEEDTARSQHDKGDYSLIDFNRAGVPLMELVTEPVIHDAKTAGDFARELQLTLRALGISDANMEKGEMRVEANVSVSSTGERSKKYVEIKNLNSFKSVEAAIEFEIARQISVIESGQNIEQETRGWNEIQSKTFVQRSKETAKDYRYFPDPDLPKLNLSQYSALSISREDEILNKIPAKRRVLLTELGITSATSEVIIQSAFLSVYVDALLELGIGSDQKLTTLAVNYLLTDLAPLASVAESGSTLLTPPHFLLIMKALQEGKFTTRIAKDIIIALAVADADPLEYAKSNNLIVEVSAGMVEALVLKVLAENETVVAEYKAGKTASLQYLVGQAMKQSRGTIAPNLISDALTKAIG